MRRLAAGARRWIGSRGRQVLGLIGRTPRTIHPLFDEGFYLEHYKDLAAANVDAWTHYERHGRAEGRRPSVLFDPDYYLAMNEDVAATGVDPLHHFMEHGGAEGRDPIPFGFSSSWYLQEHPDVAATGENPLLHFLTKGEALGWDPSPDFSLEYYRSMYPDVVASGMNPLVHYLRYGQAEGRTAHPRGGPAKSVTDLIQERSPDLNALRVVTGPDTRRITVVTDSIGPDSLFGGVATALMLATLWAERTSRTLRIATRHAVPDGSAFGKILALLGINTSIDVEFVHAPTGRGDVLEVGDEDLFLTTSWWTTAATLKSIPASKVAYILQEDERIFYPLGGSSVRASDMMNHPDLTVVVNTSGLYEDLIRTGITNLRRTGSAFEPSFSTFADAGRVLGGNGQPRNMFVYARPHNPRNLFDLTLEAIDQAIAAGHLPSDQWKIHLVGRDVPAIKFCDGSRAVRPGVLSWSEYKEMLPTIDLGLSLMSSAHPSYPPIDLAVAGAFVVTNTWPGKPNLTETFDRITMAEPTVDDVAAAIGRAVERIRREGPTPFILPESSYTRTWRENLSESVERLARTFGDV